MKKGTKFCLFFSIFFITVGFAVFTLAAIAGGGKQVIDWAVRGDFTIGPKKFSFFGVTSYVDLDLSQEIYTDDIMKKEIISQEKIRNLDVKIGFSGFIIKEIEGDDFYISCENISRYQYYVEDGTLYIKEATNDVKWISDRSIILYVPTNTEFNQFNVGIGGGYFEANNINAETICLLVQAGQIKVNNVNTSSLFVEVELGETKIRNANTKKLDMSVKLGSIGYNGYITEDANISCELGSITLKLKNDIRDHNFDTSCELGSVKIGSYDGSGFEVEKNINHNSPYNMKLECELGNIVVTF